MALTVQSLGLLVAGGLATAVFAASCGEETTSLLPTPASRPTLSDVLLSNDPESYTMEAVWLESQGSTGEFSWRQDGPRVRWDATIPSGEGRIGSLAEFTASNDRLTLLVACDWFAAANSEIADVRCTRDLSSTLMMALVNSLARPLTEQPNRIIAGRVARCYGFFAGTGSPPGSVCIDRDRQIVLEFVGSRSSFDPAQDQIVATEVGVGPPELGSIDSVPALGFMGAAGLEELDVPFVRLDAASAE